MTSKWIAQRNLSKDLMNCYGKCMRDSITILLCVYPFRDLIINFEFRDLNEVSQKV